MEQDRGRLAARVSAAALALLPVVALAQPAFQPPPDRFQTPSGNVHCQWGAGTLRCVVEATRTPPAQAARCSPAWRGVLALSVEGGAEAPCAAAPQTSEEDFVLGYGARWEGPGITCRSEESGLRCTNRAGHGFQAARSAVELF